VAVEKLPHQKMAEKTLRQEALQTTFLIFWTFWMPKVLAVLTKIEFFNSHAC
jgi:hypothetical protein